MFGLLKNLRSCIGNLKANILKKEIKAKSVCRFIFDQRYISIQNKKIKHTAYLDKRYNDLSVYDYKYSKDKMFDIGDYYVGTYFRPNKKSIAMGVLKFEDIQPLNLKLISYPYPHKLHINIVGIPSDDILKRHIAHKLADSAELILRNN